MSIYIIEEITTRKVIVSAKNDEEAMSKVESGLGEEVSVEVFRQSVEITYHPKDLFISDESTHSQDALGYVLDSAPKLYQDHSKENTFWKR